MEKLTMEQKKVILNLMHYDSIYNRYISKEQQYHPNIFNQLYRWLSELLDLNFKSDIYNNPSVMTIL